MHTHDKNDSYETPCLQATEPEINFEHNVWEIKAALKRIKNVEYKANETIIYLMSDKMGTRVSIRALRAIATTNTHECFLIWLMNWSNTMKKKSLWCCLCPISRNLLSTSLNYFAKPKALRNAESFLCYKLFLIVVSNVWTPCS